MTWSDSPEAAPEAGWYTDPAGSGGLRYWDGTTWTGHVTPPRPPAAAPPGHAPAYAPGAGTSPVAKAKTPVWVWLLLATIVLLLGAGAVAAVAVPTFRIARDTVRDEEAKANVRAAYGAATALRSASGSYLQATPESLAGTEPRLTYTTGESRGVDQISVDPFDRRISLAVRSESGTCWVLIHDAEAAGGGLRTGRVVPRDSACSAASGVAGLVEEEF